MAYSEELQRVNADKVRALLPAIIYIGTLMVLGLLGNPLVVYFYGCKLKPTPSYMFIVALAVFDLITCSISMPVEMTDLIQFYTFESSAACRLLRFINYFASIASGCTLLAIAVDRYRKICKPFKTQITIRMTRWIIFAVVLIALACAWPALIIYDVVEVNVTENVNLVGYDCTTIRDEDYTMYITYYNAFLFFMFAGAITSLLVLYILVGRQLRSLRSFRFYATKTASKSARSKVSRSGRGRPTSAMTASTDDTAFGSYCESITTATEIPIAFADPGNKDLPLSTIQEASRPSSASSFGLPSRKIVPYDVDHDDMMMHDPRPRSLRNCTSLQDAVRRENKQNIIIRANSANNEKLRAHLEHLKVPPRQSTPDSDDNRGVVDMRNGSACSITSARQLRTSSVISEVETRDAHATADIDEKKLRAQNINTRKYTVIMISITAAFIISFLPYLGLITWRTLMTEYEGNLFSNTELAFFQIGLNSFLLSSACNPLIYGFLNSEFQYFVLSTFCCYCKCVKNRKPKKSVNSTTSASN